MKMAWPSPFFKLPKQIAQVFLEDRKLKLYERREEERETEDGEGEETMPLAEELEDEEERRRSSSRWVEIFIINDFFNFLHALAISVTVKKGKKRRKQKGDFEGNCYSELELPE